MVIETTVTMFKNSEGQFYRELSAKHWFYSSGSEAMINGFWESIQWKKLKKENAMRKVNKEDNGKS